MIRRWKLSWGQERSVLKEEGYLLMGAAFEVYNQIGFGLAEEVYHQSLQIELRLRQLPFESKPQLTPIYKGQQLHAHYRPDLVVYDAIIVELKAVRELISDHEAQLFNYMRISNQRVGYLINFGHREKLEWKRLII